MAAKSVADIEGEWSDPSFVSSLIQRCKQHWKTPIPELPDLMLATYLNKEFAIAEILPEARDRIQRAVTDGTELFNGQLSEAVERLDKKGF